MLEQELELIAALHFLGDDVQAQVVREREQVARDGTGALVRANVEQSVAKVVACREIVEPLRSAWHEAALSASQS